MFTKAFIQNQGVLVQSSRRRSILAPLALAAVAILGTGALVFSPMGPVNIASAAPSQDDVDRAREAENLAELSVAQLEIELAAAQSRAEDALIDAEIASEELNAAKERLEQAIDDAKKAAEEAAIAEQRYEEGLSELAGVVQLAYRTGGGALDSMAPYLQSDGLKAVEQRRTVVSSFGDAADDTMQEVSALRQVADILTKAAQDAKKNEEDAYEDVEIKADAAKKQAESAQAIAGQTAADRDAMLMELAQRRNTTKELEEERIKEAERIREEEERRAREQEVEEPPATGPPSTIRPERTPDSRPNPTPNPTETPTPNPDSKPKPQPKPEPKPKPQPPSQSKVDQVISYARSKIGSPYVWGGNGPWGYDCSGITYMAYQQVGISIPRTAEAQYNVGRRVAIGNALPGDLVFWARNGYIYHVALYSGPNTIISAHQPGTPMDEGPIYTWANVLPYVVRIL